MTAHLVYVEVIGERKKSYRVVCGCGWRSEFTPVHMKALELGQAHAEATKRPDSIAVLLIPAVQPRSDRRSRPGPVSRDRRSLVSVL